MHPKTLLGVTAALLWPLMGCVLKQQQHLRPAIYTQHGALHAGLTNEQKQEVEELCYKGMPSKTADLGTTEYIFRHGYVLEHSSTDKIPLWVCEHVKVSQLGADTERSDLFKADPDLKGPSASLKDYAGSGYDRGHQAPAGNEGKNQKLQDETFYLSNMAPQFGNFNRNSWKALETKSRDWVQQYGEAYEITGPLFWDPKEEDRTTATGLVNYFAIGPGGVSVPPYFYKIIVVKDGSSWKSIAFVMPNKVGYKSPYNLAQYIRSVEWIEERAGLNFMPDLTSQQSLDLESRTASMW